MTLGYQSLSPEHVASHGKFLASFANKTKVSGNASKPTQTSYRLSLSKIPVQLDPAGNAVFAPGGLAFRFSPSSDLVRGQYLHILIQQAPSKPDTHVAFINLNSGTSEDTFGSWLKDKTGMIYALEVAKMPEPWPALMKKTLQDAQLLAASAGDEEEDVEMSMQAEGVASASAEDVEMAFVEPDSECPS